jgi:hypothetical protein
MTKATGRLSSKTYEQEKEAFSKEDKERKERREEKGEARRDEERKRDRQGETSSSTSLPLKASIRITITT